MIKAAVVRSIQHANSRVQLWLEPILHFIKINKINNNYYIYIIYIYIYIYIYIFPILKVALSVIHN